MVQDWEKTVKRVATKEIGENVLVDGRASVDYEFDGKSSREESDRVK